MLWRPASAADGGAVTEHPLCTFTNRFVRQANAPFQAVAYAADASAPAAATQLGDQLVLRMTTVSGDPGVFWAPNGDGSLAQGAIPHLDLPR